MLASVLINACWGMQAHEQVMQVKIVLPSCNNSHLLRHVYLARPQSARELPIKVIQEDNLNLDTDNNLNNPISF